jgi:hypothetical protein
MPETNPSGSQGRPSNGLLHKGKHAPLYLVSANSRTSIAARLATLSILRHARQPAGLALRPSPQHSPSTALLPGRLGTRPEPSKSGPRRPGTPGAIINRLQVIPLKEGWRPAQGAAARHPDPLLTCCHIPACRAWRKAVRANSKGRWQVEYRPPSDLSWGSSRWHDGRHSEAGYEVANSKPDMLSRNRLPAPSCLIWH